MPQNILITGGAGFIGSNVALSLVTRGYNVTVIDNLSEQIHGKFPDKTSFLYSSIKDKVNFIHGDITNQDVLEKAVMYDAGGGGGLIDTIIHLAAETGTGQSMYTIKKYTDVNIGGTALLLDILANKKHNVKKVVAASSRAVYGEGKYRLDNGMDVYPPGRNPEDMSAGRFECTYNGSNIKAIATDEHSLIHPASVYGITKQTQEALIMTVCPTIGITPVAFRYQNVYGPGQSLANPYTGILSVFSTRIRNNNPINIFEDGKESRDFVYINDVVQATILGIEKEEANGRVFNVGTGIPVDVFTVAVKLIELFGIKVPVTINGKFRLGDIRHNFADISLARNVLGFEPRWSFDAGIAEFVNWVLKQAVQEDKYDCSINEMITKGLYK